METFWKRTHTSFLPDSKPEKKQYYIRVGVGPPLEEKPASLGARKLRLEGQPRRDEAGDVIVAEALHEHWLAQLFDRRRTF